MIKLPNYEQTVCSCATCQDMCTRPCWPTPQEAKKLIQLGHALKLMCDHWVGSINGTLSGDYYDIYLLCGANIGQEGRNAGWSPRGLPCVFQDKSNGLCTIHDVCKPVEGRLADCNNHGIAGDLHKKVAAMWENKEAQILVDAWWENKENPDPSWVDSIELQDEG